MPKYQLSIGAIILSVLVPLAITNAAYNDVTLTTDTVLTVDGKTLTVSGSSALIESIVVNSTDFVATMLTSSTMIVTSADKYVMAVSGIGGNDYSQECTSASNTLTITIQSGSTRTVKVIPSATTCTVTSSTNTSGGGRSSSGGGGSPPPVVVLLPPVTPTPAVVPGCPAGVVCTPKVTGAISNVVLTNDLSRGSQGADVEKLQQFLAQDSSIYPEGLVTGYFGPATERAVKRFQAKYGISVGRVGPQTRAKLQEVSKITGTAQPKIPTPTTPVITPTTSVIFTKLLSKGVSGDDVISLQKILNKDSETRISETGVGSLGNETNYFGSLTERAIQKFQVKYGIAKEGDGGYGLVGPKTRAKLNEFVK